MAKPKSLKLFILLLFISSVSTSSAFAQEDANLIDDTVENFDAIIDEGNPFEEVIDEGDIVLEEVDSTNQLGSSMPEKDQTPAVQTPPDEYLPKLNDELPELQDTPNEEPLYSSDELFEDIPESKPIKEDPVPLIRQKNADVVRKNNRRRYIEHPNAAKGLIRIDKDRVYYYKPEQSEKKFSVSVMGGVYDPTELSNPETGYTFSETYSNSSFPMLLLNFEKPFFKNFESLKYYLGGGFYFAEGNGQYDTDNPPPETPQEEFMLFVFPLSFGINYYLHIWDNQWLIPYGGGGVTGFLFGERRDDDLNPDLGAKWGLSPAGHFQGGVALRLGRGPRAFVDLDREYGINSMWLTFEYKNYVAFNEDFDFSSEFIGGGLYLVY